jgi:inorganic pyrophosphatase
MSISNYLESLPLNEIAKYSEGPPKNGVPFSGYPQQHPTEKDKIILVYDPLGANPAVIEFMLDDVLHVEEVHSAVTESGKGMPLVKLWIRKGAHGVILEPFEVDEPVKFIQKTKEVQENFLRRRNGDKNSAGTL